MHKNVLFRGCTRPAMFLGVPYVPFFIGAGAVLLLAMYTNLLFLVLLPVVIFIMRQMARRDEMIFRLLGLHWLFKLRVRNVREHEGMWVFSPISIATSRPRTGNRGRTSLRKSRYRNRQ